MRITWIALTAFFFIPLAVSAAVLHAGDSVNIRAGETVPDDVYAGGSTVLAASTVQGDLYAVGGTILVTGPVAADAVLAGGTVTVTAPVGDDLRVGGGTVLVQGVVEGDVILGSGQVHVAGNRIGGDVLIGAGSVRLDSPVQGDVQISGGDVFINGPITGNVYVDADRVTLGSNAVIFGNFSYTSPREAVLEDGAEVRGAVNYAPRGGRHAGAAAVAAMFSGVVLVKLLMQLIGAILVGLVFRRWSISLVQAVQARPLAEFGRGLVVCIVLPVVSVLLFVTILGIPLGILGFFAFGALLVMSWLMAPVMLGSFVYGWFTRQNHVVSWKTVFLGIGFYFLLGVVPIVGWVAACALMLMTAGAMARLKWQIMREWR